ncbi:MULTISPECIES: molybdopterin cofactor-binding domain-containing protein [unclassified Streptomyces]|uniref:molybdopterin cofactor-binding domain-containing protein n=1 Tax=unclassified Streptomyces TaxID=2593676 RepID=UPI002365951C|nr:MULTISPECIES: molybdopterin cofactor-binding domain-containing protein [unclassified Streptomyces]MDF3144812.1 molybdopterin-dependent oxidoreductase [Streptomyces sp. T21Q-yed]WDF43796.1 molybdopterin-dependent oxidoreductase [Streptomyces sp. T12]
MAAHHRPQRPEIPSATAPDGIGRRRFLGYVVAASTLTVAAPLGEAALAPTEAAAAVPSVPGPAEIYDLNDMLTHAALPTANLITIRLDTDGTASFALPRAEVGQGITTSSAMLIAEELDLPLEKIRVTLADARPELLFNQVTGGSNTTISTFTPIRVAAAVARGRLLRAAALELGEALDTLTAKAGVITSTVTGKSLSYGELAEKAASVATGQVSVTLKEPADFKVIGTARSRVDALAAVTGRKKFAMDVHVPDALPTMVCRPPTINGTVGSVSNLDEVRAMPGITDAVRIPTGVAVRGRTFGQCIDAVRALEVTWQPGTAEDASDDSIRSELRKAELPLPALDLLTKSVDARFTFHFASNSALETNCAIADVREDSAEIWASLKTPIVAQEEIALKLGLPVTAVKVHVTEGGGSFGRKLFHDAAAEAAEISKAMGKPVKLMWHRTDDFRQGRTHPMSTSRVRATYALGQVLTYDQRHTSVATDFGHGVGEIITAEAARLPVGDLTFSETIFTLTQQTPYNFGVVTQLLSETDKRFHTGSMRNIYSPNVRCAQELVVDELAKRMGKDPYRLRRAFLKDERARAVLDKVAEVGEWGRDMPDGTAQGIAIHPEYHAYVAVLAEIDCRPETTGREIPDACTGPRVTKVVCAVDVGLAVNPRGLQAQMMGGTMDGIAITLSSGLHLAGGHFLEGSWDNYFYTRQWNTPPELEIVVMPPTTETPGGAGELAVAGAMAAVACAYGRATGTMPTTFPLNHGEPLGFEPLPTTPPIPASPTDGLSRAF